eukprot:CAMPEP_0172693354 /NCGR_PEP_ID=MMETSP1074-20121228/25925_1 /TAXON_ID=2916 /ORGANISM="Ceratium fusus, Strain PA161109" /LENGTH=83 /DNA_ID=CAMNT_0013513713 /DNA_START=36 /DNA_END=287 /DNA_ORIENTATION=+
MYATRGSASGPTATLSFGRVAMRLHDTPKVANGCLHAAVESMCLAVQQNLTRRQQRSLQNKHRMVRCQGASVPSARKNNVPFQ